MNSYTIWEALKPHDLKNKDNRWCVSWLFLRGKKIFLGKILGTQIPYKAVYVSWEIKNMLLAHLPRESGFIFYQQSLKEGKDKMSPRPKITFKNVLRVSVFYETLLCISQCRLDWEAGAFVQVTA